VLRLNNNVEFITYLIIWLHKQHIFARIVGQALQIHKTMSFAEVDSFATTGGLILLTCAFTLLLI
jgi:hypothetical protein